MRPDILPDFQSPRTPPRSLALFPLPHLHARERGRGIEGALVRGVQAHVGLAEGRVRIEGEGGVQGRVEELKREPGILRAGVEGEGARGGLGGAEGGREADLTARGC